MDKDLDLNASGNLPDGTAASQSGGGLSANGAGPSDIKRGYTGALKRDSMGPDGPTDMFLTDEVPIEERLNTQSTDTDFGGFLPRPHGRAR